MTPDKNQAKCEVILLAALARYDRLAVEKTHVEALAEEAKLKIQRTLFMLCDFDVETYRKQCKVD